jgi:hypothetical protein
MRYARSTISALAVAGALALSSAAQAEQHFEGGSGHHGGADTYRGATARHRAEAGMDRDRQVASSVMTKIIDKINPVNVLRDVAEGLGSGEARGRGGSAPAPLLGLSLLGQAGVAAGLFAAWRRRKNKSTGV